MSAHPLILCPNCEGPVSDREAHMHPTSSGFTCERPQRSSAEIEQQARKEHGGYGYPPEVVEDLQRDLRNDIEEGERRLFLDALAARLEIGAREYGNESADKPLPNTVSELEAEALDVAGWGYILWVQIRRRCERLQSAVDALLE